MGLRDLYNLKLVFGKTPRTNSNRPVASRFKRDATATAGDEVLFIRGHLLILSCDFPAVHTFTYV